VGAFVRGGPEPHDERWRWAVSSRYVPEPIAPVDMDTVVRRQRHADTLARWPVHTTTPQRATINL
jgi:hypothetical protein